MAATDSFNLLIEKLQVGDERAAAELFQRFAARLMALAQTRLAGLCDKVDAEDVLQSVFCSFFTRYYNGQFQLCNWESLWALLTVMTVRKCGNQAEYYRAARRDVRREEPLALTTDECLGLTAWAREPTPEEAASLADTLEQLFQRLQPRDRDILRMHLQGHTVAEIGVGLRVALRTVKRSLARTRQQLRTLDQAPPSVSCDFDPCRLTT